MAVGPLGVVGGRTVFEKRSPCQENLVSVRSTLLNTRHSRFSLRYEMLSILLRVVGEGVFTSRFPILLEQNVKWFGKKRGFEYVKESQNSSPLLS